MHRKMERNSPEGKGNVAWGRSSSSEEYRDMSLKGIRKNFDIGIIFGIIGKFLIVFLPMIISIFILKFLNISFKF